MKLGPVEIIFGERPGGVWLTKSGQAPQDITIPAVIGAFLALFLFCCCARVVL